MLKWLPWKYLIKRTAKSYGFIDPLSFLARLRRFAQPSEVQEPIELLRAGIVFHARGLINSKAIQHNLDWVWPYWVMRQFNPADVSFIPRAFSFSQVNLTHRNWTAVGHPELSFYPLVDPRGLVTPTYNGWSIDIWIVSPNGPLILPSTLETVEQNLYLNPTLMVQTSCDTPQAHLTSWVELECQDLPAVNLSFQAATDVGAQVALAVRPYNPEGIQFVEDLEYLASDKQLRVNGRDRIQLPEAPQAVRFSDYSHGDVFHCLKEKQTRNSVNCQVGMATAAALFPLEPGRSRTFQVRLPLQSGHERTDTTRISVYRSWKDRTAHLTRLQVPDQQVTFLFETAVRTLLLLSAEDPLPGPFTYRRFWFRDACFMLHALLLAGETERCREALNRFPSRQKRTGYFHSQNGEWDSNGQVLWIMDRYCRLSGRKPELIWKEAVIKGARWIEKKRHSHKRSTPYPGLLPPGFSAEHFGPNDYYFWDNFWGLAGLKSAAHLCLLFNDSYWSQKFQAAANSFRETIEQTLEGIPEVRRPGGAVPAAPGRRMDAGAVGSLVADYPLQLTPAKDPRMAATAEYLLQNCFYRGGFFQDMIHSGINAYLTLSIAQTLLRNGDPRHEDLFRTVADLASPTGQWPEAIHPRTLGGCMGDGQHGWAAAEWVSFVRSLFVREENGTLILGSGVPSQWLTSGQEIAFGPTATPFGPLTFRCWEIRGQTEVCVEGQWFKAPPRLEVRIPDHRTARLDPSNPSTILDQAQ
ncbi:hypothetical protein AKJ60_00275 [candidate division MSBL1 archaeon SCGC-AAA385M11]|nr:hypothetical protein AKJ60_00275 [candidate division MSBL1 archaeon SCGC-AAA385M11]